MHPGISDTQAPVIRAASRTGRRISDVFTKLSPALNASPGICAAGYQARISDGSRRAYRDRVVALDAELQGDTP
jgi:hypothetical protein